MANSVDREIRITASDNGVFDRLSRLKEGALAMGRGIAEDSRKQATSSRELIKLMNDEIALIEKRNKLNSEGQQLGAREKFAGGADKSKLSKELQRISVESKEDKMQTDLLKQILQATLKTSQAEITANREGVKSSIVSDRQIDTMEDHEEALRQTFQKQLIRDSEPKAGESQEDARRRGKSGYASMGKFVKETDIYTMGYQGASEMMTSRSQGVENKFGKSLLAAGGLVLGGAAMSIGPATDYFEGIGDIQRLTGGGMQGIASKYGGLDKGLDLTHAQAMKRASQLIQASGGKLTDAEDMHKMLALERGHGIDPTVLAKTQSMLTGSDMASGTEAFGLAKVIQNQRGMTNVRLPDILQLQQEMVEKQFRWPNIQNRIFDLAHLT